jgi:hypothetical protein
VPDDDWMLAQGTVEFRQTERDHANGRDRAPKSPEPWWPLTPLCGICRQTVGCECASDFDAAAGVSPETEPAAAKEAS